MKKKTKQKTFPGYHAITNNPKWPSGVKKHTHYEVA